MFQTFSNALHTLFTECNQNPLQIIKKFEKKLLAVYGFFSPSARGCEYFFLEISRFTVLSRFFVMLVLLLCKLSEHYSQTNFPIIKTKPFKVTKYKKVWQIFRPKWVKIKIFVIILSLLLKNENKDTHYKYT